MGSAQIDFSPTATGRVSSLLDSDPGVGDEGVDKENPLSLLIRAVWCRQGHVETLLQHVALSVAGSEPQEPCALVCVGTWSPDNGLDQWGLCANLAGPKLGDNSALRCRSYGLSHACPVGSWSHRVTQTTEHKVHEGDQLVRFAVDFLVFHTGGLSPDSLLLHPGKIWTVGHIPCIPASMD